MKPFRNSVNSHASGVLTSLTSGIVPNVLVQKESVLQLAKRSWESHATGSNPMAGTHYGSLLRIIRKPLPTPPCRWTGLEPVTEKEAIGYGQSTSESSSLRSTEYMV